MSSSDEEASIQVSKERSLCSIPPVYAPSFYISHENGQNQTFCIPSDGSCHVRSVPELQGMGCDGSFYGWLIMRSCSSCHLFNPATLNKIQLPPLPDGTFCIPALTSSPNDPKCVVMFFSEVKSLCVFCRVGDGKWIQQAVGAQNGDILMEEYISAVSRQGKVYLFFFEGVAVIQFRDDFACVEVYRAKSPPWLTPHSTTWRSYFLKSCGDIFRVDMVCSDYSDIVRSFVVLKLDLSNMIWEKVESLGNRIFLLGNYSDSISLVASEFGAKGNCLYFFAGGRTELYVFDMDSGTITNTQPCPNKCSLWDGPIWMVLNCNVQVKKQVVEVMEEMQITSSSLLPELLEMIFQFQHLGGILRLRFASKAFMSMNLPVRSFQPQVLSNSQHVPWLISFPRNASDICHFYHPIFTDVYTMNLPQLRGAIVQHAKFGWLLMSDGNHKHLFFFNPFTTEIIILPVEAFCPGFVNISFSSPPTSSDCVVFGLKHSQFNFVNMAAYRKVQDCWSFLDLRNRPYTFIPSHSNPVFHNGMFYCLSKDGKLGVYNPNVTTEEDMWTVYTNLSVQDVQGPSPDLILEANTRTFMMESNGDIYSVFVGFMGSPVCVYKLDQSEKEMKWIKVETLGDRVMFLSHTTSLLLPAALKGTENRIYFPRLKGNSCVYYSLSSGKYHSFREQEPQPEWIETCEHWNCTWFQNSK